MQRLLSLPPEDAQQQCVSLSLNAVGMVTRLAGSAAATRCCPAAAGSSGSWRRCGRWSGRSGTAPASACCSAPRRTRRSSSAGARAEPAQQPRMLPAQLPWPSQACCKPALCHQAARPHRAQQPLWLASISFARQLQWHAERRQVAVMNTALADLAGEDMDASHWHQPSYIEPARCLLHGECI